MWPALTKAGCPALLPGQVACGQGWASTTCGIPCPLLWPQVRGLHWGAFGLMEIRQSNQRLKNNSSAFCSHGALGVTFTSLSLVGVLTAGLMPGLLFYRGGNWDQKQFSGLSRAMWLLSSGAKVRSSTSWPQVMSCLHSASHCHVSFGSCSISILYNVGNQRKLLTWFGSF